MIFKAMQTFNVYPPNAVVKVGDTTIDIAEGKNAGAWSVGVVSSSNDVGLSEAEWNALSTAERAGIGGHVRQRLLDAGADAVIDTLAELPALITQIERRLQGFV